MLLFLSESNYKLTIVVTISEVLRPHVGANPLGCWLYMIDTTLLLIQASVKNSCIPYILPNVCVFVDTVDRLRRACFLRRDDDAHQHISIV